MTKQSGNMLFILLVAIAILGMLAAVMTRSGSSSDDTGNFERTSIQASNILKYAAGIETAVQSLLARGCSETELRFLNPILTAATHANPNAPTNKRCDIFEPEGSGMLAKHTEDNWIITPSDANQKKWWVSNGFCVYGIGTGTTTCTRPNIDIQLIIIGIQLELCNELNRQLGVASVSGAPPSDNMAKTYNATMSLGAGSYEDNMFGDTNTATAANIRSKKAACVLDTAGADTGKYTFYYVILAR